MRWKKMLKILKDIAIQNSSVRKTQQDRLMCLSNCAVCGKKKSRTPLGSIQQFLMIFEMIPFKWIKHLRNFCWMEKSLYLNCI